ncbi:MAG TPA: hypothetical protein VI455_19360 [Terriglobia bacterium]
MPETRSGSNAGAVRRCSSLQRSSSWSSGTGFALPSLAGPAFLTRLGFLSAAALLTHQLPVASFLYLFPAVAALQAGRDRAAWIRIARNGAVVFAVALALATPFLARSPRSIPPEVAAWARDWFRLETEAALRLQAPALHALGAGRLAGDLGLQTWPFYVITYLGVPALALLVLGLAACWLRRRGPATTFATVLVAVHVILFTGAVTEKLPLWPSLYPTRIGIWLAPALAVALAGLGSLALGYAGRRALVAAGILWLGLFAAEGFRLSAYQFGTAYSKPGRKYVVGILANESVGGAFWVATFSRDNAVLTPNDLQAFSWVREHTPPSAVFATNTGDGGELVAAVAHRSVINPHFNLLFFYTREVEDWQRRTPINYIYVGSEASPDYPRQYTAEALDRDPAVELVFRAGEARVYQVKRPLPGAYFKSASSRKALRESGTARENKRNNVVNGDGQALRLQANGVAVHAPA